MDKRIFANSVEARYPHIYVTTSKYVRSHNVVPNYKTFSRDQDLNVILNSDPSQKLVVFFRKVPRYKITFVPIFRRAFLIISRVRFFKQILSELRIFESTAFPAEAISDQETTEILLKLIEEQKSYNPKETSAANPHSSEISSFTQTAVALSPYALPYSSPSHTYSNVEFQPEISVQELSSSAILEREEPIVTRGRGLGDVYLNHNESSAVLPTAQNLPSKEHEHFVEPSVSLHISSPPNSFLSFSIPARLTLPLFSTEVVCSDDEDSGLVIRDKLKIANLQGREFRSDRRVDNCSNQYQVSVKFIHSGIKSISQAVLFSIGERDIVHKRVNRALKDGVTLELTILDEILLTISNSVFSLVNNFIIKAFLNDDFLSTTFFGEPFNFDFSLSIILIDGVPPDFNQYFMFSEEVFSDVRLSMSSGRLKITGYPLEKPSSYCLVVTGAILPKGKFSSYQKSMLTSSISSMLSNAIQRDLSRILKTKGVLMPFMMINEAECWYSVCGSIANISLLGPPRPGVTN